MIKAIKAIAYHRALDTTTSSRKVEAIRVFAEANGFNVVAFHSDEKADVGDKDSSWTKSGINDAIQSSEVAMVKHIICFERSDAVELQRELGSRLAFTFATEPFRGVRDHAPGPQKKPSDLRVANEISKNRGFHAGPAPYGYNKSKGFLVVDKEESAIVLRIFQTYATSMLPTQAIAAQLNREGISAPRGPHWHGSCIGYMLKNPVYAGLIRSDTGEMLNGKHAAIVAKDLFRIVGKLLEEKSRRHFKRRRNQPSIG